MKKRITAILMVIAMFASLGFLPGGEVDAAGSHWDAKIPAGYQKGYTIYRCIDISVHQGSISVDQFRKLKSLGIKHIILRSSGTWMARFGQYKDKRFVQNINNASKAGLKIGVYHFSSAKTPLEAEIEAQYTLKQIKPYRSKIKLPVAFDYEFGKRLNARYARKKGRKYMTNIAIAYCDTIKKAGFKTMVYGSASMFNGYVNRDVLQSRYPIWMAHYTRGGKATNYSGKMYMWQYSSSGRLKDPKTGKSIIKGNVDLDYIFVRNKGDAASAKSKVVTPASAKKTTSKTKAKAKAESSKYKIKATGNVYKRKGPAKSYKKVGVLKKGSVVTVLQTKNGWGKIGKNCWVSLKYSKRI